MGSAQEYPTPTSERLTNTDLVDIAQILDEVQNLCRIATRNDFKERDDYNERLFILRSRCFGEIYARNSADE